MRASRTIRSRVRFFFVVAAFCGSSVGLSDSIPLGLGRYQSLVVSDSSVPSNLATPVSSGVRVTYLGTNGYLLETSHSTILIDPYFSRIALMPIASNSAIQADITRINSGMERLSKRIDAILVTHGHFDHLLDVPEIARRTGASVIASPTSCYLSQAFGLPASHPHSCFPCDARSHFWRDALPGCANRGAAESTPSTIRLGVWRAPGLLNRARCKAHLC